jgi:hypothetical protein
MNTMTKDKTRKAFMLAAILVEYIWSFLILLNANSSDNKTVCLSDKETPRQTKIQWTWASLETRKLTQRKLTIQLAIAIIISVASLNEFFWGTGFLWSWFLWVLLLWWWQLLLNAYCFLLFFFLPFFALFTFLPNLLLKIYCQMHLRLCAGLVVGV